MMTIRRSALVSLIALVINVAGAYAEDTVPKGWVVAGSKPANYEFGVDSSVARDSTKSAYIRFRGIVQDSDGFGTLMQTIAPDAYRGKRLKLSGLMKTKDADGAEMWMRIDGPSGAVLSFDNMGNRAVKGTTDWKRYEIVLDVPQSSIGIALGFYMESRGTVWADAFKLEEVDTDVPVTGSMPKPLPKAPVNLNFDQ